MGGSQSTNTLQNIIDNTISTVVKISNTDAAKVAQGQYIDITAGGDVIIDDITMKQAAYVNLSSVSQLSNTQDIQNQITNQLSQMAESLTKGINFGNFSESKNEISSLVQSTIQSVDDFSKTCLVDSSQAQQLMVKAGGDVIIRTIKMDQMQNVMQNCLGTVLNDNKISNKIDNIIKQTATSKTIGIDPTLILFMVLLIVLVIGGVGTFALKSSLPYIIFLLGIFLIIVGIVYVVIYKKKPKSEAKWYGFTAGIGKTTYCSRELKPIGVKSDLLPRDVEKQCLSDENCSSADWTTKDSTFYSGTVSEDCIKALSSDSGSKFVNQINPKFFAGVVDPGDNMGKVGYIFINTKTGKVLRRRDIGWVSVMDLGVKDFSVTCNNDALCTCDAGKDACMDEMYKIGKNPNPDFLYYIEIDDEYKFKGYKMVSGKWVWEKNINGPGMVLTAKTPDEMDEGATWTCVKNNIDDKKELYIGAGLIAGGSLIFLMGGAAILSSIPKKA